MANDTFAGFAYIAGFLILLAVLVQLGNTPPATAPIPKPIAVNQTATQCTVQNSNVILGPVQDYYTGAKLPFTYHELYITNDNVTFTDLGKYADGTVKILTPGQMALIAYNINGSTSTEYANVASFIVPCAGGTSTGALDGGAYQLINKTIIGGINIIVKNSNNTANSATNPQSLNNKSTQIPFELDFPQFSGYGTNDQNGNGMMLICSYNGTAINRLDMQSARPSSTMPPSRITFPNNLKSSAWEYPAQTSNGVLKDSLVVQPTTSTGTSESINCTGVDKAWYLPTNSNLPQLGYQDNNFNDVGDLDFSFIINASS